MKKITRGLVSLLVGELLVISQKDKSFKKSLQKKKGIEKLNYIFSTLFNFNKDLVEKAGEEIQSFDLEGNLEELKTQAEATYLVLQNKVHSLEEKVEKASKKQLDMYIAEIKEVYLGLKEQVKTISEDMAEKYDLEEKLVAIKKNIDTIRKSIQK